MVIVLSAFLMAVFISYFFEQEEQLTSTGFTGIAQSFNTTVLAVHAQWLMDNKPNVVALSLVGNKEKQLVTVNQSGWLDISEHNAPCEQIWQLAMTAPMALMKFTIVSIEIHKVNEMNYHRCQYVLPSGQYFEYYSGNGQVSQVKQRSL